MFENKLFKRVLSILLCAVLLLSYLPANALQAKAATPGYVENTKKADLHTIDWADFFGPDKLDTEYAGGVWTDKSVFAENTNQLPGITLQNSDNFLIALSAMGSTMSITGHTSVPTDTMLVLDVSGSMVDDTYEVGTVRWGNGYRQVNGIDMSMIQNMVTATNDAIASLMEQNANNRVGVVLYSGNTSTNQAATPGTATVLLPLGRYAGDSFLSVDAPYTTATTYTYNRWNNRYTASGEATYVPSGSQVSVSVKDGLKTEAGGNVADTSKQVTGGTYIQNGLYQAMQQFLAVEDVTLPEGNAQAGKKRLPVLVLMSDGAPTIATTNATPEATATNIGDTNTGDGTGTTDRITFLTQLTAAYVRGRVSAHYGGDALVLTLGLGTESSSAATNTLYPAGSGTTLTNAWRSYLTTASGSNVNLSLNGNLTLSRNSAVAAMNYVDKYFYASDAEGLIQSFKDVVGEIALKTATYATLVEGGNANYSGYVTFEDELGQLIHVHHMSGIRIGNKIYTGEEMAKAMTDGTLGTVNGPTALGDELIATVRERIPGLDTTAAQQLVDHAYNDGQLYHDGGSVWSNYIGWYGDSNGSYVGFWDKDSGYENAPANAIYANRSYGYLGENQNGDMMHVVVMVRTDLRTLHQTVLFKIPASLLPLVKYNVTLAADDPDRVEKFERVGAEPMQLVYEVGLRSDINAVNLDAKIQEHLQKGQEYGLHNHVHRNADGSVTLYTNQWKADNDTNQNDQVDIDEVDAAEVAESHFHPATDNSRYYYTEDTLLYKADGTPATGAAHPSGTGYIHYRGIYSAAGKTDKAMAVSEDTLENNLRYDAAQDRWYILAGTMYKEMGRFRSEKGDKTLTNTLDYSDYPVAFQNGQKQDLYNFLGNNGTVRIAPATGIILQKQVDGQIPGVNSYTFHITAPAGVTPSFTDANGDAVTGVTDLGSGSYSVVLAANEQVYITGIPAGQQVQIREIIAQTDDYYVKSVTGAAYAGGVATATVPAASANGGVLGNVVFTNAPYTYGDLVISKEVAHDLASDPADLAGKVFTFRVKLEGARIAQGDTFSGYTVGANGYLMPDITLKRGESVTITGLPVGTVYTVTEQSLPDGFRLDSINGDGNSSQITGTIETDAEKRVDFINRYHIDPVDVTFNVDVTKVLTANTPYTGNETFKFLVQRYNGQGYDDEKSLEVAANATNSTAVTVPFDEVGTYYFQIIEQLPQAPTPGMNYSTMRALFRVIITDEGMDGRLESKIEAVANTVVDGQTVKATFENIYEVGAVAAELDVQKTLYNDTGAEKSTSGFQFTMTPDQNNPVVGQTLTVTSSAQGKATFRVLLTAEGTYRYTVKEVVPAGAALDPVSGKYVLNGMYYDASEYIFTVIARAQGTQLVIDSQELTFNGAPVPALNFINEYILEDVQVQLPYSKSANVSDTFTGLLQQTDSTYLNPIGTARRITLTPGQSGQTQLTFQKVGTYHYTFTEENAGQVIDGVHYDSAVYHITVNVTDKGDGTLQDATTIHKLGAAQPVNSMDFTNEYRISGEQSVTIGGNKTLRNTAAVADRFLTADEFEMGLYSDAACTVLVETAPVKADGSFAFRTIVYTASDLGEHKYYIKEIDGGLTGITYDDTVHTVTVTVYHESGALKTRVSADHDKLQVTNFYAAGGVDVKLKGEKVLAGDWSKVTDANKTFTFELYAADENFVITNDTPVQNKMVLGAGEFEMELRYEDGQEGFHYFVLKEQIPATRAGGVSYDAGEYHITVNVSDPGHGQLEASVTLYRPGTGNTEKAVFINRYEAAATVYTPTATKVYRKPDGTAMTQTDGQFTFVVLENGQPVSFGENQADGTVVFEEITYTAPGVHEYTIVEYVAEGEALEHVTYDDTAFAVKVTVTDDGLGKLTAAVENGGVVAEFNNVYTPPAPPTTDPSEPTEPEPTPSQPVKPPSATPVTGDETNLVLWSFLAVFSMTGLFVLLLTGKKEQEAE